MDHGAFDTVASGLLRKKYGGFIGARMLTDWELEWLVLRARVHSSAIGIPVATPYECLATPLRVPFLHSSRAYRPRTHPERSSTVHPALLRKQANA